MSSEDDTLRISTKGEQVFMDVAKYRLTVLRSVFQGKNHGTVDDITAKLTEADVEDPELKAYMVLNNLISDGSIVLADPQPPNATKPVYCRPKRDPYDLMYG